MATSASYTINNGQMGGEVRGGTETYYVPDTQGSLNECRDSDGKSVGKVRP